MSAAIVYIDISEVCEGALDELQAGLKDLVDFIEAKEPRLLAYNVYFSADGTTMTVMNVHPDAASLEYHMEMAGPLFRRFVGLVTLSSIHIYGEPSEKALELAHEKARLLGGGAVEVEALHVGSRVSRLTRPSNLSSSRAAADRPKKAPLLSERTGRTGLQAETFRARANTTGGVSPMIARVGTFRQFDPDKLDPAAVEKFRSIIKSTPGYVAGFHLRNPETGKAVSFTVYENPEALKTAGAALARHPDIDPVGIDPDEVDYYSEVIAF